MSLNLDKSKSIPALRSSSASKGTSNLLELNPPKSAPESISMILGAASLKVGAFSTSLL